MKVIAVTGGAGFIGSNLCKFLLSKDNKVICIDNLYSGRMENIKELMSDSRFKFINHDMRQPKDVKCDEIYHLACPASPVAYQKDPIYTTMTSIQGTVNALEIAKKNKAKILFTSTSEVYGDPEIHPQREDYKGNVNPIGIRSCYDEGKRVAESLCMDYYRTYKVDVKIVRIFNTYGPNMDPQDGRVVSNFIVQALTNKPITMYGDGTQTRSFQYVTDLISGIYLMMQSSERGPINIGNPDEFTLKELADKVKKLTNTKSKIIYKPLPSDDPRKRKPDITLAKTKLKWAPVVKLDEGLVETIKYFEKQVKK